MTNRVLRAVESFNYSQLSSKPRKLDFDIMTDQQIQKYLEIECSKMLCDLTQMSRKMLVKICPKLNYIQATEIFLQFRGDQLEKSKTCDINKL